MDFHQLSSMFNLENLSQQAFGAVASVITGIGGMTGLPVTGALDVAGDVFGVDTAPCSAYSVSGDPNQSVIFCTDEWASYGPAGTDEVHLVHREGDSWVAFDPDSTLPDSNTPCYTTARLYQMQLSNADRAMLHINFC